MIELINKKKDDRIILNVCPVCNKVIYDTDYFVMLDDMYLYHTACIITHKIKEEKDNSPIGTTQYYIGVCDVCGKYIYNYNTYIKLYNGEVYHPECLEKSKRYTS